MSATVKVSEQPCFFCGKTEKTSEMKLKNKRFAGIVCVEHYYQVLLKGEESNGNEKTNKRGVGEDRRNNAEA
ncbi:MAG: hypothetical protein AB7O59_19820 [Pirellulales bacterium]